MTEGVAQGVLPVGRMLPSNVFCAARARFLRLVLTCMKQNSSLASEELSC
jgi:hypothetical protein